jgi:anti-sigma B factor antagonist
MALITNARVANDTVVLDLKGRLWVLDLHLRDEVQALLQQGCPFFVLNIAEVDYIDSSGLGQLISIWASVRKFGGNVVLLRPMSKVRRLLVTTSLQTIFDVYEDEERAKAAVRRDWSLS